MYGTGWAHNRFAGPSTTYNNNNQYGGQPTYGAQGYGAPPPQYENPQREYNQGASYQPSNGYYGQQNEGIQLQQPVEAYHPGGQNAGPVPSKIA
jgi:hypothetical protein